MIDKIDRRILTLLQENGRMPNAEIARQVGLVPSAILERVRKLEERGIIRGYRALLDHQALGYGLTAYILVSYDECAYQDDVAQLIAEYPEVLEVHAIAGEDCFLAKVKAKDTGALTKVMRKCFGGLGNKIRTKTVIVLETIKESSSIPLDGTK
jgi:Lrp/AsnC family leucine-responsive transcriptional regulator